MRKTESEYREWHWRAKASAGLTALGAFLGALGWIWPSVGGEADLFQLSALIAASADNWAFWTVVGGSATLGGWLAYVLVWRGLSVDEPQAGGDGDVAADAASLRRLAAPFDPNSYIDDGKARRKAKAPADSIFIGLDDRRRPVYLPRAVIDKNHIEILGESGTGKSSIAGVLLSQLAGAGECVVIFDPKFDRNLPGALARAGERYGYPFHFIDLQPQADFPQLNPFSGCREDQVEELLQVSLELGKTGEAAVDYHRGKDREASGFVSASCGDGRTDMLEILKKASQDERVVEQENLWRELRQLGRVKAFHTRGGLNLEEVLSKPGVLYVVGSTKRLEIVAAQKLIFQRILQILDERRNQEMPVALFLDELKYLLSPASLRAAGTVRDRNCHLIFAHQSLGDLDDCPGLSPRAVRGAVWGNCGVKIAYRALDSQTAQELSAIAGESVVAARSKTESDIGTSATIRQERREYIPPHIFCHLPKPVSGEASVGVVFGLGPAFYLSTRWIESGPTPEPERAPEVEVPEAEAQAAPVAEQDAERRDDLADLISK